LAGNSERYLGEADCMWYEKPCPTFSDALALVRKELRMQETFRGSPREDDMVKVSREFVEWLTDAVCHAA